LTRAACLLFAVPLAALLAGTWLGGMAAKPVAVNGDLAGAMVGFLCLTVAMLIMARRGAAVMGALRLTAHRGKN
jgi:hypothetical protein